MPCQDGGPSCPCSENEYFKERVDELTQNLCYLCGVLIEEKVLKKYANKRILGWQKEHHKSDEKRVRRKLKMIYERNSNAVPGIEADKLIESAEEEHPVSSWHKKWFERLAKEELFKLKKKRKTEVELKKERKKALNKLSKREKVLLGIKK